MKMKISAWDIISKIVTCSKFSFKAQQVIYIKFDKNWFRQEIYQIMKNDFNPRSNLNFEGRAKVKYFDLATKCALRLSPSFNV